ncbi:MAG: type II secretion system protein GspG [Planctomycetota bacterium]
MTASLDDPAPASTPDPAEGDAPDAPRAPARRARGSPPWNDRRFPWSIDVAFRVVAFAVIGMLLIGLVGTDTWSTGPASEDTAAMQARNFAQALDLFRRRTGALPARLDALVAEDPHSKEPYLDRVPNDPWGTPYRYVVRDARRGRFEVRSAGRDRAFATDDDVVLER